MMLFYYLQWVTLSFVLQDERVPNRPGNKLILQALVNCVHVQMSWNFSDWLKSDILKKQSESTVVNVCPPNNDLQISSLMVPVAINLVGIKRKHFTPKVNRTCL